MSYFKQFAAKFNVSEAIVPINFKIEISTVLKLEFQIFNIGIRLSSLL
jgi:hypothetical protein